MVFLRKSQLPENPTLLAILLHLFWVFSVFFVVKRKYASLCGSIASLVDVDGCPGKVLTPG
jgi:hypothetical protein